MNRKSIWSVSGLGRIVAVGLISLFNADIGQAEIPGDGLIAYWRMNESSGTTAGDSSGLAQHGALINGPTWTEGKKGNALLFDGVNDYVTIGDLDLSPVSVSMWVRQPEAINGWASLVMKRRTYGFEVINQTLSFRVGNGSAWSGIVQTSIALNQWEHFVGVYDGSAITLYKNGVQVGTLQSVVLTHSNNPLLIGSWTGSAEFFKGQIDEVLIYNRALTASEVQMIYSDVSDGIAPTISITAPANNTIISGSSVIVSANASDNVTVSGVQFTLDGVALGSEDATFPYSVTWDSTSIANGVHTLFAVARDAAGNRATSSPVIVTVSNDLTAPLIFSVSATSASPITATVNWATDEPSDSQVEFGRTSAYGSETALDPTAVTSHSQSLIGLVAGTTYNYRVKSRDAAGNLAVSANHTFSTQGDTTSPSTPLNVTAIGLSSSQISLAWTASTDNVAVAGYRLFRNGSLIASVSQTSYIDTGLVPSTTYTYTILAFDSALNISAESPGATTTTLNSASPFNGPLRVSSLNPRYFTDNSGKAIYMAGPHTWANFVDNGYLDPPTPFDYEGYLDFIATNKNNFIRLWTWEQSKWMTFTAREFYFDPSPFVRSGPGLALDGKPKFDLTLLNQAYFDRLRQRVVAAGDRGIYVAIMLFDGWSLEPKGLPGNPWPGHPFHIENNINGINGDPNGDNIGIETHTLANPAITAIHEAYLRKVVDSVNDLDNVLYEVTNEDSGGPANANWQYHIINYVKSYEATKAKRHPVGMTGYGGGDNDAALHASPADWISPSQLVYLSNPPAASGSKVVISDTDHLWGANGGDRSWVWKNFTRGVHSIFMETFGSTDYTDAAHPGSNPFAPEWVSLRQNMGYTVEYAKRLNLNRALPRDNSIFSSGYGLANATETNAEYLGYLPSGGSITVNLAATPGSLSVEWLNPATGAAIDAGTIIGGASRTLTAPFSGDAVVYLNNVPTNAANLAPTVLIAATPVTGPAPLTVTFSSAGTTDPENQPLSYLWDFGDGSTSTVADPVHTYNQIGPYIVRLQVSDGVLTTLSDPLPIMVGNTPRATIRTPGTNLFFRAGDVISFSGQAADDEDGTLPPSAFTWQLFLHHNTHIHPWAPLTGTTSGTLTIDRRGHDYSGDTRYEIVLTVIDSSGLEDSDSVFIYPEKVNLFFDSAPINGLVLKIDGIERRTPFVHDSLVNFEHLIDGPNQTLAANSYTFQSWSDGGTQNHLITVPASDQAYVATFSVSSNLGAGLVAHWKLDEATGATAAIDSSGNNRSLGLVNGPTFVAGRFGNALNLRGNNDYANAGAIRIPNAVTVSCWINLPQPLTGWASVIMKIRSWGFEVNGQTLYFKTGNGSGWSASIQAPVDLGAWQHFVGVYNGNSITLYKNGVPVGNPVPALLIDTNFQLLIGSWNTSSEFFRGQIDDVRIYDRALGAAEIQQLYQLQP